MRYRFTRILPGAVILLAVVLCLYWIPLLSWFLGQVRSGLSIPESLPFGTLARVTLTVSVIAAAGSTVAAYPYVLLWRISGCGTRRALTLAMIVPMLMGLL